MSENTRHDPVALAKAVLSDPAMDQALTWLVELETATPEQRVVFNAWIQADPANRDAFDRAQAIWNSHSVRDAASSL
jgi:transmembrane sensor